MKMRQRRTGLPIGFPRTPRRRGAGSRGGGGVKFLPIILFVAFAFFFYQSNQETVPMTGRKQMISMSKSEELALGFNSYRQILSQENVVTSGPEVDLLKNIGKRLTDVIDAPGFEWEFNLIDSPQANAFCVPGGKVAVYTGILPVAANPDGLAVIVGHEIAHAIARHGAERMAQKKLQQWGQLALGMSMSDMSSGSQRAVMGAFGLGAQYGLMLPYSRNHETEADYMGLIYAARACFNPEEAPKVWERMKAANKQSQPEFLSTHPDPENRIKNFAKWMPEAKAEYQKYCN